MGISLWSRSRGSLLICLPWILIYQYSFGSWTFKLHLRFSLWPSWEPRSYSVSLGAPLQDTCEQIKQLLRKNWERPSITLRILTQRQYYGKQYRERSICPPAFWSLGPHFPGSLFWWSARPELKWVLSLNATGPAHVYPFNWE